MPVCPPGCPQGSACMLAKEVRPLPDIALPAFRFDKRCRALGKTAPIPPGARKCRASKAQNCPGRAEAARPRLAKREQLAGAEENADSRPIGRLRRREKTAGSSEVAGRKPASGPTPQALSPEAYGRGRARVR